MAVRGSFSKNTVKRILFTEIWHTLFRVLSSITCSSIGSQLEAKQPLRGPGQKSQGRNVQTSWSKTSGAKRPDPKCQGMKCPGPKCQGEKCPGPKCHGAKRPGPKSKGAKR